MSENKENNTVQEPAGRRRHEVRPEVWAALKQMAEEDKAQREHNAAYEDKQPSASQQQENQEPAGHRHHEVRPEVWAALEQMAKEEAEREEEPVFQEPAWEPVREPAQELVMEEQAAAEPPVKDQEPSIEYAEQAEPVQDAQEPDRDEDSSPSEPAQEQEGRPAENGAPETAGKETGAADKEPSPGVMEHQEAHGSPAPEEGKAGQGQEAAKPDIQQEEAHTDGAQPQADTAKEDAGKKAREQAEAEQDAKDARKKKDREGADFHKDSPKDQKGREQRAKGLFERIRNLAMRVYHRVKHAVERAIGRGRIPTLSKVNEADFSRSAMDPSRKKDDPSVDRATQEKSKEKGRDWKELFYHGIARRILGKDAYMHAIQQNEKQEAPRQEKGAQEQNKQAPEQKENTGQAEKVQPGRTEHPGSQEKPERSESTEAKEQGNQEEKKEVQREPEEMKGKFNALHKIITNDLEDKYSNARESKEAYLDHYTKQLQEKLTELNHGEPVQVSASREDERLEIRINHEQEQYGGYPSFMGCSMIRIDIDKHLNITSAEAFVPIRQSDDGKFIGRKIDVTETLGAYIVSDLARNFREDYNRGAESYNLTSRNEFEKTMHDAAAQGRGGFTIDNISYSISVKDNQIQLSQADGGKAFTIAMDAGSQKSDAAREAYEAKSQELQDIEKKLKEVKDIRNEKAAELSHLATKTEQAAAKASEVEQRVCDIKDALRKVENQIGGKYPGAQKMQELKEQQKEILKNRASAFREKNATRTEANVVRADRDNMADRVKELDEHIAALEQKAGAMRDACRDAKEQYDNANLGQKEIVREIYQAHTKSAMESRESSIRVFEEILPGQKNELGGNFKLEDLNKAMEETGRTSMEEALNAQSRDMQHEPSTGEEREAGLEGREMGDELE